MCHWQRLELVIPSNPSASSQSQLVMARFATAEYDNSEYSTSTFDLDHDMEFSDSPNPRPNYYIAALIGRA